MSEATDYIRKTFGEGDDKRDAGLKTPYDIDRINDISYGSHKDQVLDVYRPKRHNEPMPVIVNVHGGGWVYGDKERYQYYCMNMAQRGFVVINYTYRLAPEVKFPASLEDTNLVMEWLYKNRGILNVDLHHVFMLGDSAGANLLGLYMNFRTSDYQKQFEFKPSLLIDIEAICLTCGAYVIEREEDRTLAKEVVGEYDVDALNVLSHVNDRWPPVMLVTCDGDFLKAQAPLMQSKLLEHSIPFEFHFYTRNDDPFQHCFFLNIRDANAKITNDDIAHYFYKFINK